MMPANTQEVKLFLKLTLNNYFLCIPLFSFTLWVFLHKNGIAPDLNDFSFEILFLLLISSFLVAQTTWPSWKMKLVREQGCSLPFSVRLVFPDRFSNFCCYTILNEPYFNVRLFLKPQRISFSGIVAWWRMSWYSKVGRYICTLAELCSLGN